MAAENAGKPGQRPLEGIRVLEFGALIAAPSCTRYMADLGADVIKFERFPGGDISREINPDGLPHSPMFFQHNAGKRSLCVDLARPEGLRIALDLAATADVVVEAFTPGVMARLGLGYEDLKSVRPDIVVCSISGFGQSGPNAARPGYAHIAHAMTGWLATQFLYRDPPEEPRGPGVAIGDLVGGLTAFGAICAALVKRSVTGQGDHIDTALFDSLFSMNDFSMQSYLLSGNPGVFYHPVYKTRDGYLTLSIGPDHASWERLCTAMDKPMLAKDPRFIDAKSLWRNIADAAAIVSGWLAEMTSAEADRILTGHHVVSGVVHSLESAAEQPQVTERGLLVEVDDPLLGPVRTFGSAFRYAGAPTGPRTSAPQLGEHNDAVLANDLKYSPDRIDSLRSSGLLGSAAGGSRHEE